MLLIVPLKDWLLLWICFANIKSTNQSIGQSRLCLARVSQEILSNKWPLRRGRSIGTGNTCRTISHSTSGYPIATRTRLPRRTPTSWNAWRSSPSHNLNVHDILERKYLRKRENYRNGSPVDRGYVVSYLKQEVVESHKQADFLKSAGSALKLAKLKVPWNNAIPLQYGGNFIIRNA